MNVTGYLAAEEELFSCGCKRRKTETLRTYCYSLSKSDGNEVCGLEFASFVRTNYITLQSDARHSCRPCQPGPNGYCDNSIADRNMISYNHFISTAVVLKRNTPVNNLKCHAGCVVYSGLIFTRGFIKGRWSKKMLHMIQPSVYLESKENSLHTGKHFGKQFCRLDTGNLYQGEEKRCGYEMVTKQSEGSGSDVSESCEEKVVRMCSSQEE